MGRTRFAQGRITTGRTRLVQGRVAPILPVATTGALNFSLAPNSGLLVLLEDI